MLIMSLLAVVVLLFLILCWRLSKIYAVKDWKKADRLASEHHAHVNNHVQFVQKHLLDAGKVFTLPRHMKFKISINRPEGEDQILGRVIMTLKANQCTGGVTHFDQRLCQVTLYFRDYPNVKIRFGVEWNDFSELEPFDMNTESAVLKQAVSIMTQFVDYKTRIYS